MTLFALFTIQAMFVSQMAFFASVSDPRLGGTYMTLLNTVWHSTPEWQLQKYRFKAPVTRHSLQDPKQF